MHKCSRSPHQHQPVGQLTGDISSHGIRPQVRGTAHNWRIEISRIVEIKGLQEKSEKSLKTLRKVLAIKYRKAYTCTIERGKSPGVERRNHHEALFLQC